jgi:hypothetical protein
MNNGRNLTTMATYECAMVVGEGLYSLSRVQCVRRGNRCNASEAGKRQGVAHLILEGRRSPPAGALGSGSPFYVARDANPSRAGDGGGTVPAFGRISQASSASFFSHGESLVLALFAFRWYPVSSSGVQRNLATLVRGSFLRGAPRRFLGLSMALIMWLQIILDKGATWVFNVATLIRRQIMRTPANVQVVACYIERLGFFRQEVRYVAKVPEGYRLARQYPHSWTWPVRDSIEAALADAE